MCVDDAEKNAACTGRCDQEIRTWRRLCVFAAVSLALYAVISYLSLRFAYNVPTEERPILFVTALFAIAFLVYLAAIRSSSRAGSSRRVLRLIIASAGAFRLIMLPSHPIQEVDIYRYLWDGRVVAAGVDPFQYNPEQVRRAGANRSLDRGLRRLVRIRDDEPVMAEILERVHFADLPTVYPAVSQFVFAGAAVTTPRHASVWGRVCVMKLWLVVFDMATLWLVARLLRALQWPQWHVITYAWCPLLVKEIANSGHLDSIAVFLTTLALYLAVERTAPTRPPLGAPLQSMLGVAPFAVLGLAVAAKLYPVVLAPLLTLWIARSLGRRQALLGAATMCLVIVVLLWPMVRPGSGASRAHSIGPPVPATTARAAPSRPAPSSGLQAFLSRWEINDFLFLIVVENVRPPRNAGSCETAWFAVMPDTWRERLAGVLSQCLPVPPHLVPFLAARMTTGMAFVIVGAWLVFQAGRKQTREAWLTASFLTIAWFWLLCPTQNPWYWTWVLPLLPFARHRAWLVVSGLVFAYYLRFWLSYHWADTRVLGTPYRGTDFFDFVVTWLEYGPWLLVLILSRQRRR